MALALGSLMTFSFPAWSQDEADIPPEEVETTFEEGMPPPPDAPDLEDDEPPRATEDFRRAEEPRRDRANRPKPRNDRSRTGFTGRRGGGGGSGFSRGGEKKVEFHLVEEGNPRYNTNRPARANNKYPR